MSGSTAVPADWSKHTDFTALQHPDMDCQPAGLNGKIDVVKVTPVSLTGRSGPDAVVVLECAHSTSEWPQSAYVYSDATGTPTLVGTLVKQSDSMYVPTVKASGSALTLGEVTASKFAPGCCPDLHYTQTFTWSGSSFTAGARQDVLLPCGDTAFTTTATQPNGATGHGSIVLEFKNRLPQACTIHGYPGVDAVDASGHTLAHATRTLNGFTGGAHSIPTLTVAPGQTASANVEWVNFDPKTSGACTMSHGIEVTPADTSNTVELSSQVFVCGLQVHPTVAGTSGNG
ncbi:MAG: DUF4232 domain-containing protein [Jatrophihabitantaceae bacterium]